MTPSAVIFDLGGTLIDNWDQDAYIVRVREIARVLSMDSDELVSNWIDPEAVRMCLTGGFADVPAQLEYCVRKPLACFDAEKVNLALNMHDDFTRRSMVPRAGAIDTLKELRSRGCRVGLLSDCGPDIPTLWGASEFAPHFDGLVFSCRTGTKKPDPKIYQLAYNSLGVKPEGCVYVADGNSMELTGARNAGMSAVLICMPQDREQIMQREDPRSWDGPVIEDIREILSVI